MNTPLRLTYDQLAERTGRSPEGARMLARRRRWRIERGNDGKARVIVDEPESVVRPPERPPGRPDGRPPGHLNGDHPPAADGELVAELRQRVAQLEVAGQQMNTQLLRATERAACAEGEAKALRGALADLAGRLDRATMELQELRRPWWRRWIG